MRRALALGVLLVAATACGTDEEPRDTGGAGTSVEIAVTTDDGSEPQVMQLTCDPAGGDHPNAGAACRALAEAGPAIFEPVPQDRACTMIFGGPQTATITGTLRGADVDASFSRVNGCEIARWDALGTEVFDVPLQ